MNKKENPKGNLGKWVNTSIHKNRMYAYSDEKCYSSYVEAFYIDVEKLPQHRRERLHQIVQIHLGYAIPDGISEVFGIGNKRTIKWLWDCHQPVVMSHEEVSRLGATLDTQDQRLPWEVAQ